MIRHSLTHKALKILVFFHIMLACSVLFSQERLLNRAVARVNGRVITFFDMKKSLNPENPHSVSNEAVIERKDSILKDVIADEIVRQEIENLKIKVSEKEIDLALENVAMQNNVSLEELKKEIAQQGLDWDTYRNEVVKDQLKVLSLKRHIAITTIDVDEQMLRLEYETQFKRSDHYTASHIVLTSSLSQDGEDSAFSKITKIHRNIISGEVSFEDAARNFSQDESAMQGGRLGTFPLSQMVPEFSERLQKMEEGEISTPFKSRFGWHIIKLEKVEKKAPPPYREVRDQLLNFYYQKNMEKAFESWIRKKIEESRVEILF